MPENSNHLPPMSNSGGGLAHHKLGPGVVAMHSSAFQEMDDYAPYRIAFLLLFIVSSVVLWASYKLICEREGIEEEEDRVGVYQRLTTAAHRPTDGGDSWTADFGEDDDGTSLSSQESDFLGK